MFVVFHISVWYTTFLSLQTTSLCPSVFASHSSTHQDRSVDLLPDTQSHCIYSFVPGKCCSAWHLNCLLFVFTTDCMLCTCSRLSCRFRAKSSTGRESSLLSAFAVVKIGHSWSFREKWQRYKKRAKTMGRKWSSLRSMFLWALSTFPYWIWEPLCSRSIRNPPKLALDDLS